MKIEEVRPSFTVYLIASEVSRLEGIADSLSLAGYMVASFSELTAAISEVYSNPPHFVLFDATETKFNLKKAIRQVAAQLPESHIYLVTPATQRESAAPMLDDGVYDLILTPLATQTELVRKLDRAAERDYFMYMNERLSEAQASPKPSRETDADDGEPRTLVRPGTLPPELSEPDSDFVSEDTKPGIQIDPGTDGHLDLVTELFAQKTPDDAIGFFVSKIAGLLGECPVLYLKYIANRRVLLAAQNHNLDNFDLKGLGLNFNEHSSDFRTSQLRDPQGIPEIASLVEEVFHSDQFFALPVESMNEIQGVVLLLRPDPDPELSRVVNELVTLLNKSLTLLESEKRLHVATTKDSGTELLNRATFLSRVRDEISRARRTNLPVCLALISLDQYDRIKDQAGPEEAQTVLRMAARIFEKHSRVNDVIGRTGEDEFGIILAHTHERGALVKAERLRRIIESADFSKVVKNFPNITISLGVAEYPSMVRDAEELVQAADEALFQVRKMGNKTCVAKAPDGFVADFEVQSKGL